MENKTSYIMNFFNRFKKPTVVQLPTDTLKKSPKKSPKEIATEKGEPYVAIISVDLDPDNVGNGAFELDWNDKFIANLVRAGYQTKANDPENEIVDRWFRTVCQNVVLETFEQEIADPDKRSTTFRRGISDNRSEFS
jgi:hypothetical protein